MLVNYAGEFLEPKFPAQYLEEIIVCIKCMQSN